MKGQEIMSQVAARETPTEYRENIFLVRVKLPWDREGVTQRGAGISVLRDIKNSCRQDPGPSDLQ